MVTLPGGETYLGQLRRLKIEVKVESAKIWFFFVVIFIFIDSVDKQLQTFIFVV